MRFTDGKEKLEIEIHEGQHSWDTTVEFFDHLTTPILNGTRQVGNVRTLLTNVYNRILGMSDYPRTGSRHSGNLHHRRLGWNHCQGRFFHFVQQSSQHVLQWLRLPSQRGEREPLR